MFIDFLQNIYMSKLSGLNVKITLFCKFQADHRVGEKLPSLLAGIFNLDKKALVGNNYKQYMKWIMWMNFFSQLICLVFVSNTLPLLTLREYQAFRNHNFIRQISRNVMPLKKHKVLASCTRGNIFQEINCHKTFRNLEKDTFAIS